MLDLREVTDQTVAEHLARYAVSAVEGSDAWRVVGFCCEAQKRYSFSSTRTYPRPDHPDPNKRRPLVFLMVGILVSLRTTLENEQRAMGRLMSRFPTAAELDAASVADIAECIECAGMAETKARRIRRALDRVHELDGGLEGVGRLDKLEARSLLLDLPGFGPKAADCMLTIGLGIPSMVVDVNVFRVASGLLGLEWRNSPDYSNARQVDEVKRRLDSAVGDDAFLCQIVHTLMLLHGKNAAVRNHSSASCELGRYCLSCELDPNSGSKFVQEQLLNLEL